MKHEKCYKITLHSNVERYLLFLVIIFMFSCLYKFQSSKQLNYNFKAAKIVDDETDQIPVPFCYSQNITNNIVPSVHCATAIEISGGRIRSFWYAGTREGAKDVSIYTSVYEPSNLTWSPERKCISLKFVQKKLNRYIKKIGNPVVIRDASKRILLFFVTVSVGGWAGSSINVSVSTDEGDTFSLPKKLISSPFFNVSTLVKGRPYLYQDDTILLPVYHEMIGKFCELLKLDKNLNVIDKTRISWGDYSISPVVLPLDSKNAFCFLRFTARYPRRIYCSKTTDGGRNWSHPEPTHLPNHNSAFDCLLIEGDLFIKILNKSFGRRDNLTLVASRDQGMTWKTVYQFEKEISVHGGIKYEFSYPWILQTKSNEFHLFYTWMRKHIRHVHFNKAWLEKKL